MYFDDETSRLPLALENKTQVGETVAAASFKTIPGGKGANQAAAAAKLADDGTIVPVAQFFVCSLFRLAATK